MVRLKHPNIVQIYDYSQIGDSYFSVMEHVEGTDLRRYLHSRGILDVDRTVIIAHDIALGLGEAHHRGAIHRNVKPQNILVGRGGSIKLTDFITAIVLGMAPYNAPEQTQGKIVTPTADIYELGIVMYEMLTGHPPFDGDSPVAVAMQHIHDVPMPPSHFNPNILTSLEEVIMRCLEKAPDIRYRDGSELAKALEALV